MTLGWSISFSHMVWLACAVVSDIHISPIDLMLMNDIAPIS